MSVLDLPTKLDINTVSPVLGGHRVHVSVGRHRGRIVKLFIDMHKEGSDWRGAMHALADMTTLALQAGALGDVAAALRGAVGGPAGIVEELDGITSATSVADLVGQILELQQ